MNPGGRFIALASFIVSLSASSVVLATTRYVNSARPDDSGDGLSWATADKTLQAALAVATSGDEIWVAAGAYKPDQGGGQTPGDRAASFVLINGVSIYGGFSGTELMLIERNPQANVTILSGDLAGDDGPGAYEDYAENSYHVVSGSVTAVLDGFTISGGNADGTLPSNQGAGIYLSAGSPVIRNCHITANRATSAGAGIYVNTASSPSFRSCLIDYNEAGTTGGGGFLGNGSATITGSVLANNVSASHGGGLDLGGTTTLVNCFVLGNQSTGGVGGGVRTRSSSILNATNVEFSGNSASNGGAIRVGGDVSLTNCTLAANDASTDGGGINFASIGMGLFQNCVFWSNEDSGGMDSEAQIYVFSGAPTVNYSLIQGGWGGAGTNNISSDPMFMNPSLLDFRLKADSPAVDAGNNSYVPVDVTDVDNDGNTAEATPLALGQIGRFDDNPYVSDASGSGTAPIVDRGAYEVRGFNILYVDANGPGPGDWVNAYTKLQNALTESEGHASSQIWVADGTYYPDEGVGFTPGDRTATFQLRDHVEIYAGFSGVETDLSERDPTANLTMLSGDLNADDSPVPCTQHSPACDAFGSLCVAGACIINTDNAENSFHVVTASGTDGTATLEGFIITRGNADGTSPQNAGAGIYNDTGFAIISNCTLFGNRAAALGGGIYNYGECSPTFANCTVRHNASDDWGGGMSNVSNNIGPISPIVVNSRFLENTAATGGAMHNGADTDPAIINCAFIGNRAGGLGGGIHNEEYCDPQITNCLFNGNSSGNSGGGMANADNSSPVITNCTFSMNTAATDGGGVFNILDCSPVIKNSVFWGNSDAGGTDESAQILTVTGGAPTVNYSIVQGGWTGAGSNNFNTDPMFADANGSDNVLGTEDDNLRVLPGSPAIDSADNAALPADTADLDGDANTAEQIPFDLDGALRRIDDQNISDTGAGSAPIVDMGAYEFQANVLFVDASAKGNNDGSSWANAYNLLQSALTSAGIGGSGITEIWVAAGTYRPDQGGKEVQGDRTSSFRLDSGLALYGGFAGGEVSRDQRNPAANVTILSGDLAGNDTPVACNQDSPDCDFIGISIAGLCVEGVCIISTNNTENSYHVVTASGTDATAVIDGFTITKGNADGLVIPHNRGAGIYNSMGHPKVINCTLVGNRAHNVFSSGAGGGMFNLGENSPTVANCTFRHNAADSGGGMYNSISNTLTPTITNSMFRENVAGGGGGMSNDGANSTVTNCTFVGNRASSGGGMENTLNAPRVTNCSFRGNSALSGGGGMLNIDVGSTVVTNCTFSANTTDDVLGGGVFTYNGGSMNPTFTNCLFWNNSNAGGMDESAQIQDDGGGTSKVNYSIVQGGWSGSGSNNLNVDPLFVDADGPDNIAGTEDDDLRLSDGSPAIDAANTPALPLDTYDADGDGNTTERYPFELAGNPRILDDPNTTDTGVPGSPVVDMGAYEYFADCNGNGLPDQCDLSCGVAAGPCDIRGCGGSSDCGWAEGFPNGVPDECELGCGAPDCDDCNLNGVPDACDIANATSLDVNADFVPDECSQFDPGCVGNNDWSCFNNWNIPGDVYPDNAGPATYSVILDEDDDVFLDVDVTIDTLRITDNAVLNVTQTGVAGDLSVVQAGGLLVDGGFLYINNSRVIDVPIGPVRFSNGGLYAIEPTRALAPGAGDINAASVTIAPGAAMSLTGTMRMNISGNFRMDGIGACAFCGDTTPPCNGSRGGIIPPPKFDSADATEADVFGDLELDGSVDFLHASSIPFDLGGSFNNRVTNPGCFNWSGGGLRLVSVFPPPTGGQVFEAGGRDVGASQSGFFTAGDSNFSFGSLEVQSGRGVTFRNTFANTIGTAPCAEAIYVRNLTLRSGSSIELNNVRVYYETKTEESGVSITAFGCGGLVEISACTQSLQCADGNICTLDACDGMSGDCSHTPIELLEYGDADISGIVELGDILCGLLAYSGNFANCPPERTDIFPCQAPDGLVELGDILGFLSAYSGTATCPDPCP